MMVSLRVCAGCRLAFSDRALEEINIGMGYFYHGEFSEKRQLFLTEQGYHYTISDYRAQTKAVASQPRRQGPPRILNEQRNESA